VSAILGLAALGTLAVLYARFVEPRWIEVTSTRVPTSRLPVGHRGVRIVHLSDLHSDSAPRAEKRLPATVASLEPDLILFTGDAANTPAGLSVFRRCLAELTTIAPTFAVKGNWDTDFFPQLDRFGGTGATELDGSSAAIAVQGTTVYLVGARLKNIEPLGAALESLPTDGPAIVLYHCPYPDVVPPRLASRVDLFLAGHVHGGQVALPIYGALITFSKFGKRFERGFYPDADGFGFPLYVSRGIGMEGRAAPRVRFCARPEVALIELVPDGSIDANRKPLPASGIVQPIVEAEER
jgi:uncharacterized protein